MNKPLIVQVKKPEAMAVIPNKQITEASFLRRPSKKTNIDKTACSSFRGQAASFLIIDMNYVGRVFSCTAY